MTRYQFGWSEFGVTILVVAGWFLLNRRLKLITESDPFAIRAFWILMYPAGLVGMVTLFLLIEGYDAKGVLRVLLLRDTWPETARYRIWVAYAYLFIVILLLVQFLPSARRPNSEKSEKSKTED